MAIAGLLARRRAGAEARCPGARSGWLRSRRALPARRPGGRLRLRQRAPPPRGRAGLLPDLAPAGHERRLDGFSEGGGYERREWWSDEGWAWKEEYDIGHHPASATGDPEAAVCHVSWFEADAFARAHGARLPTEAGVGEGGGQLGPGRGAALAGIGPVWEWTSSHFLPYPGFRAYPYREYSEVFFGEDYRVLRGGSWATHPRVATRTFRNWDLPQRRQIFAGLRLAREALLMAAARPGPRRGRRSGSTRTSTAARSARSPTTSSTGSPAPSRSCPQALLRRPRRRAVRPDLRAARVLPDPRRAGDPRGAPPASWREITGAVELVELGSGHGGEDARAARRAARGRHARRYVPFDVTESDGARMRPGADRTSTPACGCTA